MDIQSIALQAAALRRNGDFTQAEALLQAALEQHPQSGELHYQMAWTMDVQGREQEAVSWYEDALRLRLEGEHLQGAYLGLGSTYKNVGRIQDSLETFRRAIRAFPENPALRVFLSLTLAADGRGMEACKEAMQVLLDFPDNGQVQQYRSAIEEHLRAL